MNLINATKMEASYAMGMQPDGRELLVVVLKATFTLPTNGDEPKLADDQASLVMTDEFTGEPGFSAPRYEIDFAPRKPRCDVLLNGSAYAPNGRPVERVRVGLRVGTWRKSFDVVGDRHWTQGVLFPAASSPKSFTVMPICYNNAYGGVDKGGEDEPDHYYLENHVGIGYHVRLAAKRLEGKPLPNTEESGNPVTKPNGNYRPMAFGPLGRAWQQRVRFAGTYDQQWLDNVFPFLPADFQEEYYQAAPVDQWIDFPKGDEEVELINLTPDGYAHFHLPRLSVPFEFFRKSGEHITKEGIIDTIAFEPDEGRFMMNSRCTLPLQKSIHEMRCAIVGTMPRRWYEEEGLLAPRVPGTRRFESLGDVIRASNHRTTSA